MKDISLGALEQFGKYGGLIGIFGFAFIAMVFVMFGFLIWFIKTERENKNQAQKHSSEQYEKRLAEEKHLANSVSEMAMATNAMAMAVRTIPCMEKHKDIERFDDQFLRHPTNIFHERHA